MRYVMLPCLYQFPVLCPCAGLQGDTAALVQMICCPSPTKLGMQPTIGGLPWLVRLPEALPVITFSPSYQIWSIWVYPPKKIDLTPVHETSRESEAFQPIFPIQKMRFSPRSQGFKIPGTSALSCTANSFSRPTRSKPPTAKRTPRKNRASGTYPLLYDLVYIIYIYNYILYRIACMCMYIYIYSTCVW